MSAKERRYQFLRADLAEINNLLSMTPESALIDRMSLEHRRSQVEEELADCPLPTRRPATAHLAFNGMPVVDREGIYADFASAAVNAFSKVVTSLAASQHFVLGKSGVIPNKEKYRLLVTGTSRGSFGFEIEEASVPQARFNPGESPVTAAIGQAKGILESLVSDEETIAETIADTDERALKDVRNFLKVMADSEAVCSLSFKNEIFKFSDVGQVKRGLASLDQENLREFETEVYGHFQGFLPQNRSAEFVARHSKEVLFCRVDRGVGDIESIDKILGKDAKVRIRVRQVGKSRPRFTIMDYSPFPLEDSRVPA